MQRRNSSNPMLPSPSSSFHVKGPTMGDSLLSISGLPIAPLWSSSM